MDRLSAAADDGPPSEALNDVVGASYKHEAIALAPERRHPNILESVRE